MAAVAAEIDVLVAIGAIIGDRVAVGAVIGVAPGGQALLSRAI